MSCLTNITINIKGPGGCINFESMLIERLFRELGYQIEVNNDHPFVEINPLPQTISETEDEFIERVKRLNHGHSKITIHVTHCPWGG